jgi:hypothetical protein
MDTYRPAVRIVPSAPCSLGVSKTQGTQVLMPDGTPIPRVHRIELVADVDDVWRATIHCYVQVGEMSALGTIIRTDPKHRPWWRRLLDALSPKRPDEIDVTNMSSTAREFILGLKRADRAP